MTSLNKGSKKTSEHETHVHEKSEQAQAHQEAGPKKESRAKESHANHNGHAKRSSGKSPENFSEKLAAVKVEVRKKLKSLIHKLDKML